MSNGLNIKISEFKSLPQKQQLTILYENTEILKRMISKYKFNQKIQWIAILLLFILGGLSKYLEII